MPDTFSQLLTINEPHLVERYNRALSAFGLGSVELESFQIDMVGFSFSNTRDLMLEFFKNNRRVLHALTIKDVFFGEIEDNVFEVDHIDDLLSIEQVEFKIGTHENLTEKTNQLKGMVDKLLKEPDAWRDDAMLHEMVDLAKQTGDIRDNALVPQEVFFRHETFWASHFGGIYIFNDDAHITVICDPSATGFRKSRPWQVSYLDIGDKRQVYDFLKETGRLQEPLGSWVERSRLLELRKHMKAVWMANDDSEDFPPSIINQTWVRRWVRQNGRMVSRDNTIPIIDWAIEQVMDWEHIDMDEVDDELKFALCRAHPDHEDSSLVNRLISHYLPYDFLTRFEFNRPEFHADRQTWSNAYSEFVAKEISNTYLKDRDNLFEDLYL